MTDDLTLAARLDTLTPKQREVVILVAEGLTSKEIARKLGITESAVNQRIEVVRQRLGGLSRSAIARIYRQTNTLMITIPTSNSLTGKPIQLQAFAATEQPLLPEGVDGLTATSGSAVDELQPSTLPPLFNGPDTRLVRLAAIVIIALGLLGIAVLAIVASHTIGQLLGPAQQAAR